MSESAPDLITNPDELKLITLQFIGQHVASPMKAIDQAIIAPNNNLRATQVDAKAIIDTIPSDRKNNRYATTVNAGINIEQPLQRNTPQATVQYIQQQVINDPNQLEFDFNNSNYAKLIFDRLDSIDRKLSKLLDN